MGVAENVAGRIDEHGSPSPGWVPLYLLAFMAVNWWRPPESVAWLGHDIPISTELIAALATALLYKLGDILDSAIYKPLETSLFQSVDVSRKAARGEFGIDDAIYPVMKRLASAAGRFHGWRIGFRNETAKLLRSLILPLFGFGLSLLLNGLRRPGGLLLASAALLTVGYAWLKALHIRSLYDEANALRRHQKFHVIDVNEARLFYWDSQLVASALRANDRN